MTHRIDITGDNNYGCLTKLICPEDCEEKEAHQDNWADIGFELVVAPIDKVLASFKVEPEWIGYGEDAELWLKPVMNSGPEN